MNDHVVMSNPILPFRIIACLASGGLECYMLVTRGNPTTRDQPSPEVRAWLVAATLGSKEPFVYLRAWLIAGHGIATRDEHVAFKPTACQTRDYAKSQNWI